MTTKLWGGAGLGLVLALGAPLTPIGSVATAQEAGAKAARPTRGVDAERLTLDVKDQPLADVIPYLRTLTGRTIVLGNGPHGVALRDLTPVPVVTVQFEDVPWAQALRIVAESADCLVKRQGDRWIVHRPATVTLNFERADLRDVVQAIAAQSGANIVIGSDVPDGLAVSLRLKNVPWYHALNAVVKSVGMTVVTSKGGFSRVGEPGAILQRAAANAERDQAAEAKSRLELQQRRTQLQLQVALLEKQLAQLRAKLADLSASLTEQK